MTKTKITVTALTLFLVALASTGSTYAKSHSDERPGWGFGDKHHVHVGPPGQSVRPEDLQRQIQAENEKLRHEIEAYAARIRLLINHWIASISFS